MTKPAAVRRPPGPKRRLPGQMLMRFRKDPIGPIIEMGRDFGDIAYTRLGPFDVYVLSHPDLIRDVLVTSNRRFMKGQGLQEAKRLLGEGLLTSEGEFHHRQRRLIQPIFHHARIEEYGRMMVEDAARMSDGWRDGQALDVHAEMMRLTLVIVGKTIFDADVEGDAAHVGRALTQVMRMFNRLTNPLADVLERLPLPSTKRFQHAQAALFGVIERMIAERRAAGVEGRNDLLSMLIAAQDEESGKGMGDRQIRDEAMTLFLAGHETTAQWLTWTWFVLSRHPQVEARLHDELDSVLDGRLPTAADIPNLPYTGMVLSEVLRLYPPAYIMGRRALEDHEVAGYTIPAGSIVVMSQFATHHDPRWYPDPVRFDPSRWTDEEVAKRPRYAFFPFGGGPRLCIGEDFAWMEAKLLLATLAERWSVRVVPEHRVELQPIVTLRPRGGLPATLERRGLRPGVASPRS